ncbi:MAG TPA: methylenetetrahydrofolate reductase [Chthoniobacterales bacterium]
MVWARELKREYLRRRQLVRRVGVHFALKQCHDLLDNDVAGIHFYTLNRSDATRTIFDSLGIPRQRNTQVPIA